MFDEVSAINFETMMNMEDELTEYFVGEEFKHEEEKYLIEEELKEEYKEGSALDKQRIE